MVIYRIESLKKKKSHKGHKGSRGRMIAICNDDVTIIIIYTAEFSHCVQIMALSRGKDGNAPRDRSGVRSTVSQLFS